MALSGTSGSRFGGGHIRRSRPIGGDRWRCRLGFPTLLYDHRAGQPQTRGHVYCIYTDREVADTEGNHDHVFPLALGGKNEFVVWSDRRRNSEIGSEVDGALSKDPFIVLALRDSGVRGHGKQSVEPRWRKVSMEGRPMQVTLGKDKITVWDARERRDLDEAEVVGKELKAELRVGHHTALRFVAKAALGGGYFVYGDEFRRAVDCERLREIVALDPTKVERDSELMSSAIKFCDRFHSDSRTGEGAMYRALCEGMTRSMFIVVPHHAAVSFHVGVVGRFIGSLVVPADTERLPIDGEHDLGHIVVLGPGEMERVSFRDLLRDWRAAFGLAPSGPAA